MKLSKRSKPVLKNTGTLKAGWVVYLSQGLVKLYNNSFYKVIKVNESRAMCVPISIIVRINADTMKQEFSIIMQSFTYAIYSISPNASVNVYGIHLCLKEKLKNS